MGWRNSAYSHLQEATKRLAEAKAALDKHQSEDFVRALIQTSDQLNMAMGLTVDDGIGNLVHPKNGD